MQKKNKPKFNVLNLGFFKSVKGRWRKPRGTHNKKRMRMKWTGASPKIGYRNPEEMRGMHPCGSREVLVNNVPEMEGLKGVVVRIASSVGGRKRALMVEKAKTLGLRVVNLPGGKGEGKTFKPGAKKAAAKSGHKTDARKAEKPAHQKKR